MRNGIFLLFLIVCTSCGAQKKVESKKVETIATETISIGSSVDDTETVAKWNYEIEKLDKSNEYKITANLKLDHGWHIFDFQPGGDGLLIAPEINFTSKDVTVLDKKAVGKLVTAQLAGMDDKVRYYENEVSFMVRVRSKNKEFKGSVYYQLCDHEKCLAPAENPFILIIK